MRIKNDRRNVNLNDRPNFLTKFNRQPSSHKDKLIPALLVISLGVSMLVGTFIGFFI